MMNKCRVALLSALLASTGAGAADDLKLNVGGFMWADAGFGDRYTVSDDDQIAIRKVAVTVSPEYMNTRGVLVLGADDLFGDPEGSNGSTNDDVEFKEAFFGIKVDVLGGSLDTTIGKQPLLFGLKPNGWVADRTVQQGLEFGGAGGLNVSGQVNDALILDWAWGGGSNGMMGSSVGEDGSIRIRAGFFDTDDGDVAGGTSVTDNWFIQARADDLFGTGIYGSAGYEQIDVAGDSEGIISIGGGYNFGMFDVSLEYQGIDQNIVGTADDETVLIAEAMFNLNDQWSFYADYATADESDKDTIRIGAIFAYNEHADFVLEWSDDSDDNNAVIDDQDSIDLRVRFNF